jgi:hypothetical protein
MGTIAAHFQSYLDFATVDGTVNNGGTWVLIVGPFVLALLGLYVGWNLAAATANGVARVVRLTARVFVRPAVVAAPAATLAETAPMAPVVSMPAVARPRVAVSRRAEALARSAA